jgi:mRNA interferase RelE/StbE
MRYEIEVRRRAEKDLASIPKPDAQKIAYAIYELENGLTGNIKKLTRHSPEYRLRIGDWRVLFEVSRDKIIIYRIRHRKEAYR